MAVAAGPAGFASTVELFPDGTSSDLVGRITLRPGDGTRPDEALSRAVPDLLEFLA